MRKRWGVQVIAIAMLIFGFIVFLLGILPSILLATRGAGAGWQALLALPTVLAGCSGALLLLAFGSLLLTLVKISENAAARSWRSGASAVLVTSAGPVAGSSKLETGGMPLMAAPEAAGPGLEPAKERPVVEAAAGAAVAVAGAEALAAPAQAVETGVGMPEAVPAAVAAGVVAARAAGHEVEASATPVVMVPPWGEGVEVGETARPVEEAAPVALVAGVVKTPQEEVEDLRAQLAALEAQLAEVREYPASPDESLPSSETEEPTREAMVEPAKAAETEAVTPKVVPAVTAEGGVEAMAEPTEAVEAVAAMPKVMPAVIAEAEMEAMAEPAEAVETGVAMPEAVPAAVEVGVVAAEAAGHEVPRSQTQGRGLGKASTVPVEMAPPWGEEGEAAEVAEPVEEVPTPSALEVAAEAAPAASAVGVVKTPPEDVDALRAQLSALEAQLAEPGKYSAGPDESLPPYETEEPPVDAHVLPRLPGSDDMARIAAEMASLKPDPTDNPPGE